MHALTRRAVQSLATIRPWPKGSQLLTNDISSRAASHSLAFASPRMTAQVTIAHPPRPPPPPAVLTHRLHARQTHVHSKSVANSRNVLRNNGQLYTFLLHPLFILK